MGSLHRFWVFSFSRFFSLFFSPCFLASVRFLSSFSAAFPLRFPPLFWLLLSPFYRARPWEGFLSIFPGIVILCRVNRLGVWMERKHQQSCHCWTVGGAYPCVRGELWGWGGPKQTLRVPWVANATLNLACVRRFFSLQAAMTNGVVLDWKWPFLNLVLQVPTFFKGGPGQNFGSFYKKVPGPWSLVILSLINSEI
jgi:hypothetical protein